VILQYCPYCQRYIGGLRAVQWSVNLHDQHLRASVFGYQAPQWQGSVGLAGALEWPGKGGVFYMDSVFVSTRLAGLKAARVSRPLIGALCPLRQRQTLRPVAAEAFPVSASEFPPRLPMIEPPDGFRAVGYSGSRNVGPLAGPDALWPSRPGVRKRGPRGVERGCPMLSSASRGCFGAGESQQSPGWLEGAA